MHHLAFNFPVFRFETNADIGLKKKKTHTHTYHVILQMVVQHVIVNCASNNSRQNGKKNISYSKSHFI